MSRVSRLAPLAAATVVALCSCARAQTIVRPAASCPLPAHAQGGGPRLVDGANEPPSPLWEEARRELQAAKESSYSHVTNVDEESGVFDFDCSGFVSYALRLRAPAALDAIPVGPKGRVRAEDYVAYFTALKNDPSAPWERVPRVSDLHPGDVVAWLRADDSETKSTGHVAIVAQPPKCIAQSDVVAQIGGTQEWLVRVVDSTESPHADDARAESKASGLGEGTIGLVVDDAGAPIGYRWKGGVSSKAHATTIVLARLRAR